MFKSYLIFVSFFVLYAFYKLPWSYSRFILLIFSTVYFVTKFIFKRWPAFPNFAQRLFVVDDDQAGTKVLVDLCRNKEDGNFESDIYQTPSSFSCLVCGELSCYRHGAESSINLQPYKGLLIDRTINESLSDLFETILELYVFRWYDEIQEFKKDDERFKSELRFLFKFLTSTLLRRLASLDLNRIIYYKLIPLLIQHFQTFLQGKRQAKSQQFVEKCVLRCYMQNGLICKNIKSRNEEIKFLRNLVELSMPYLLPPYTYSTVSNAFLRELFTCCFVFPLVEIATDPLYVNDILMLIFDAQAGATENEKCAHEKTESNLVEILHNYELTNRPKEEATQDDESANGGGNLLGVEFHKLLKNQQMLIVFFQYLKDEGSINYLQFILSLESFNDKLFDPEISQNEMKELHADASHIYKTYLLASGGDYLGIQDEQLLVEMKRILDKNYECIVELKSLKPLLEAYEEIYSKLEQFYYPQFLTSDLYIKMIVGSRLFNFLDECSTERFIFNEENCEELFENNSDAEEEEDEEDVYVDYGIDLIDIMNADSSSTNELELKESETVRDLSTWKISIDKVDTKIYNNFKYYYVFLIKVEVDSGGDNGDDPSRTDELDDKEFGSCLTKTNQSWVVERKYEEFYVLDGKLKKFHGNALSRIVGLSSKRTLFKQSLAFLESKKLEFEKYLHELTNIPGLKRSELIHNFLKPPSDATTQQEDIFHHSKLVDINLKKMIKTMPAKFSQERGQNLDAFLKTFINSTESQKSKGNVPNLKDIFNYDNESDSPSSEESPESDPVNFRDGDGQPASKQRNVFKVNSIFDYLIIVLTRICNLKSYGGLMIKLLRVLQPLLNNTIEHIFHLSVRSKVNNLLTRDNINKSILFLKATILELEAKETEVRGLTKLEKMRKQKSQDTLRTLQEYFNNFLPTYLSFLNLNTQTGYFLHSVFQYSLLNKQFFYLFFNLLIEDVFPEIVDKKR